MGTKEYNTTNLIENQLYKIKINGFDSIVKYAGKSQPNHCKSCTCPPLDHLFTHVSGYEHIGYISREDLATLEEYNERI